MQDIESRREMTQHHRMPSKDLTKQKTERIEKTSLTNL
jgi:hypothetical protein